MKRKIIFKAAAILLMLSISMITISCKKSPLTNGNVITETRELPSFNTIYLNDNIDATLIHADTFKIEITTGENLIPNIISDVVDDALYIGNDNICNWLRSYDIPLEARIYYDTDIEKIIYKSVGNLRTEGYLNGDSTSSLRLRIEIGAGDIYLNTQCDSIFLDIQEGTNKIDLQGNSNYFYVFHRGLGPIDGSELICQDAFINSYTSNNIYVNCSDNLDARIYDIGNIYYKGQPKIDSYISPDALGRIIEIENLRN